MICFAGAFGMCTGGVGGACDVAEGWGYYYYYYYYYYY